MACGAWPQTNTRRAAKEQVVLALGTSAPSPTLAWPLGTIPRLQKPCLMCVVLVLAEG